ERRGHPREIVEALLAAGADREYFLDKDRLDGLAEALTTPTRTVTVQRDEEHNRYLLQIEDRSSGYPRQHAIGVDFVTAGEYRTMLANHRDMPALDGEIIVPTTMEAAEEAEPAHGAPAASSSKTMRWMSRTLMCEGIRDSGLGIRGSRVSRCFRRPNP